MIEELAAYLLSVDADERWDDLEELFYNKYGVGICDIDNLVNDLLPLCMVAESTLSGNLLCGFADKTKGMFLLKVEVDNA